MAPPKYADLGKAAKDCLSKDFVIGDAKFEVSTKTSTGVAFKTTTSKNQKDGSVGGVCEAKYKYGPANLEVTEKWNTKGVLLQTVTLDKLADGLKIDNDTTYNTNDGSIGTIIKLDYVQKQIHTTADINPLKKFVNATSVFNHKNVFIGVQAAYDGAKGNVASKTIAASYIAPDFCFTTSTDGEKISSSLHHKVSPRSTAAVSFGWKKGSNDTDFALGGHLNLDKSSFIKAKMTHDGKLTFGYTQAVSPQAKVTVGMAVDSQNLATDAHKLGLSLVITA
eukprot:CFRG3563T1